MSKIILLAFTLSLITGCAATKIADEYGSNTVTAIFACPGVNWTSKKLDETFAADAVGADGSVVGPFQAA